MNTAIQKYRIKHGDTSDLAFQPCVVELEEHHDDSNPIQPEGMAVATIGRSKVMVTTEDFGQAIALPSYRYNYNLNAITICIIIITELLSQCKSHYHETVYIIITVFWITVCTSQYLTLQAKYL